MYYISAGKIANYIGRVLYVVIAVFCVIPEIRKGNKMNSGK